MANLSQEELDTLLDAFGRLLNDQCTEQDVRRWMENREGYSPELWQGMADMGITGLLVAEDFGGTAAGIDVMERVMELAGSALAGTPLIASAVMSVTALQAAADTDAMARLLPEIAAGSTIATLLITGPSGTWTSDGVDIQAQQSDDSWHLSGVAHYVLHGRSANVWLVAAHAAQGLTLFEVAPKANGVVCETLPSFDHSLVLDRVTLDQTPGTPIGTIGNGWPAVQRALEFGLVALAGEQAGGAKRILDITVDYAKIRHQFGRPIGSFQAIKHMAADLLLEVESAISAAREAAAKTEQAAEDGDQWRNLAAFACADAYVRTAADAVQMHGGIAFTWEHPAHLYLRRSRANAQLFGTSDYYREQYLYTLSNQTGAVA